MIKLRHHAKFRGDRLNYWRDMGIFQFFPGGGRLPSWICDAYVWTIREGYIWWSLSLCKVGWNRCGSFDNMQVLIFF